jgi:SAM-dependent methyltransferase
LDLGCGQGKISRVIFEKGYNVAGIDINQAAITEAKNTVPAGSPSHFLHFTWADCATDPRPYLNEAPFDLIVCQLVISIIGDWHDRNQLLANAFQWLKPSGWLYLSASGVSAEINTNYAKLYAQDEPLIGEPYSYFSRDNNGKILYKTHHFHADELQMLLEAAGFNLISINTMKEQSSRRTDQVAYFLYATCQRPIE